MTDKIQHWFLHVDLDAFFASVEQLDHPEYRGKPVIVGGHPDDRRSVVSTASYEARKFGVHSAMPTSQAYKLCPQGIYVHGRMDRYSQLSYSIMEILKNYSPDVEQMSIDEAFLDITGTEGIFGSPKETAYKIKKEIKDATGLTVSIGLAQHKYFAKIASDINKPDGFYCVEPGKEEEFMLNLPLKKVFGIGAKSQENLKKIGLTTTRDIHERSLESLMFLCGENQGKFLYNIVRGICEDKFSKKSKSHSISSETTFPYDVNNIYALETTLLNLAYIIQFRLLKEKGYSRTVMVKIRYEDFSTVSIQQTFDKTILTIDDLFSKAKLLFEKKWEENRGVRLLGLALENIESEDKPFQQDLFDDGSEKKQKVEKAILSLSKKHPEIKVHKARMLEQLSHKVKTFLPLFCALPLLFLSKPSYAQEKTKQEEPLFKYEIDGFWEADFSTSLNSTFGAGTEFAVSSGVPVFKQQIDLNAKALLSNGWSFAVNFVDNFNKNTFTINYDGKKYLKNFKLSNRNIIFPDYYSSSNFGYNPGGGQNEAPGIILHFDDYENKKFMADFLLRYDLVSQKQAVFYGKNKVTDIKISPENFVYGKNFYIPSEYISFIKDVYVENTNGNYKDENSIKYKKLNTTDYLIIASENLLVLSDSAAAGKKDKHIPKIIVTFNKTIQENDFGTYESEDSFLGQIQKAFKKYNSQISLKDYSTSLFKMIEGEKALVIQDNIPFSPFLCANLYDFGLSKQNDAYVINKSSEEKLNEYTASIYQDAIANTEDSFKEKHQYTKIKKNQIDDSLKNIIERYPFLETNPFIYLTGHDSSNLCILNRTFTNVTNFDIGKNAENASIKVLINGNPAKQFSYSSSAGYVTINQSISDTDKITISWNEQNSNAKNGAVQAAAGFIYFLNQNTNLDISLTARIPFAPFTNYADSNNSFSSFVSLTGGLNYKKENFIVKDTLSLAVENQNTLDVYMINNIYEKLNQTFYHSQASIFETKTIPDLNKYGVSLDSEKKGKNLTLKEENDSQITGYKIPLQWNFEDGQNWTSIDVKLNKSAKLYNANLIEMAFKNESEDDLSGYEFYLQLGINASNQFNGEDKEHIYTIKLEALPSFEKNEWKQINIPINDKMRSLLVCENDIRLIVYKKTSSVNAGKICFGPYEPKYNGMEIIADKDIQLFSSFETNTLSLAYKKYFSGHHYCDLISIIQDESEKENEQILAYKYFDQINFSNYKKINIDFAYQIISAKLESSTNNKFLELILKGSRDEVAMKLELNDTLSEQISSSSIEWHTISIDQKNFNVYLDDILLPSDSYTLFINNKVQISKQEIIIHTNYNNKIITQSYFYNGDLYLTENNIDFKTQNNIHLEYTKKDSILTINETKIFSDAHISLDSNQFITASSNDFSKGFDTNLNAGITAYKFNLTSDIGLAFTDDDFKLTNFSYSIKNDDLLLNTIIIQQDYSYNTLSNYNKKSDSITLDFSKYNIPLNLRFNSFAYAETFQQTQQYNANVNFSIPHKISKIEFDVSTIAKQQIKTKKEFNNFSDEYENITKLQYSNADNNLSEKNVFIGIISSYKSKSNGFNPKITFDLTNLDDESNNKANINKGSLKLHLPFKIQNQSLSFNYSRNFNSQNNLIHSLSYTDNYNFIFSNQNENSWYYSSIPFVELFSNDILDKMQNSNKTNNSYTAKYETIWNRPLFNSSKDIFIPSSASLSVSRDITTASSINDIYQIKGTITSAFLNQITKNSSIKLFKDFNQDEYTSMLSLLIKIPANKEDITMLISGYENLLLFIDPKNTLRTNIDYKFSDSQNWNIRLGSTWTHSGSDSIIVQLPALVWNELNTYEKQISRKESFNISIGESSNKFIQNYQFVHYCEALINKNYNLNCSIGTTFNYTEEKALSLNIEAALGVKLIF